MDRPMTIDELLAKMDAYFEPGWQNENTLAVRRADVEYDPDFEETDSRAKLN